jgi:hypothetical protein
LITNDISAELIQAGYINKNTSAIIKKSLDAIVKDEIFNSYQYTYIVLDNSNTITEVNGDTTLYFNRMNSSCINQNIWLVLNDAFKQKVQSAFANTLADGQQLPAATVKAIILKGRLIFIKILVKIIAASDAKLCNSILILEKIETDQFINNNNSTTNKTVEDVVTQKLVAQLQPFYYSG